MKFVTRAGTNNYTGSGYYYYRTDELNANTWFNNRNGNPKPALLNKQGGGRIGGPIMAQQGVLLRELGGDAHPERHVAAAVPPQHPRAAGHLHVYIRRRHAIDRPPRAGRGEQSDVDRRSHHRGKCWPTSAARRRVAGGVNSVDANIDRLTFNNDVESTNHLPTLRGEVNLTDKHRASVAWNYQKP